MNLKSVLIASTIGLSSVAGAQAADIVVPPAPIAIPDTLSTGSSSEGFYIGGHTGYDWGRSAVISNFDSEELLLKPHGFLGGIYAGYNLDSGNNVIIGIDADATYNHKPKNNDFASGAFHTDNQLRWSGTARARAGYAVDRFLPYIAGGMAIGNIKNTISEGHIGSLTESQTLIGWTAGAGIDFSATDNIILRLEYRYTDYGHKDFNYNDLLVLRDRFKTSEMRLGVAYKF